MNHYIILDVEPMDGASERRTFHASRVTIGRAPGNDIQVVLRQRPGVHHAASANCGRRHGMIEVRGDKLVLHDAGTSNGWHCVNEGIVAPSRGECALKVGDRYYVGDTRITIVAFG